MACGEVSRRLRDERTTAANIIASMGTLGLKKTLPGGLYLVVGESTRCVGNVDVSTGGGMNLKIEVEVQGTGDYDLTLKANGVVELDNGRNKVCAYLDESGLRDLKDALEEIFYEG